MAASRLRRSMSVVDEYVEAGGHRDGGLEALPGGARLGQAAPDVADNGTCPDVMNTQTG